MEWSGGNREPESPLTCLRCGNQYEKNTGRSGQSPYCHTCRVERRKELSALRAMRHAVMLTLELIAFAGPELFRAKTDVKARQGGRCAECGKARSLYIVHEGEALIGLCLADYEALNRREHP